MPEGVPPGGTTWGWGYHLAPEPWLQLNSGYNNYQKEQAKEIMQHEIENDALQELSDELPFNIVRKDEDGLVGVPDEHFEDMDRHYR